MTKQDLLDKLATMLDSRSGRDALIDALDAYVTNCTDTIHEQPEGDRPRGLPLRMMAAEDMLHALNLHRAELAEKDPLAWIPYR